MAERYVRNVEVGGSSPLTSTGCPYYNVVAVQEHYFLSDRSSAGTALPCPSLTAQVPQAFQEGAEAQRRRATIAD